MLESIPFCTSPVTIGVIRDVLVWIVRVGLREQLEARVAVAWGEWREISLLNKGIPLAWRDMVFDACIRSVMLYG